MNRVSPLLPAAHILLELPAADKDQVLEAAAALFAASLAVDRRQVLASLRAREELGSTALGLGVAIPHGRLRGLRQASAAVIRLATPVGFDAPDGRPVRLFVVLLVPENAGQLHLELLSELAQMLADRGFRDQLLLAADVATLHAQVAAWVPGGPAA